MTDAASEQTPSPPFVSCCQPGEDEELELLRGDTTELLSFPVAIHIVASSKSEQKSISQATKTEQNLWAVLHCLSQLSNFQTMIFFWLLLQ